jgi:signal transduction histidine kinase
MRRRLAFLVDVVAVAAVAAAGEIEVLTSDATRKLLLAMLVLVVAVPLLWRRRAPFAALLAMGVGAALCGTTGSGNDWLFTSMAVVLACYSVAAYASLPTAVLGVGLLFAYYAVGAVLDNLRQPGTRSYSDLLYVGMLFGGTWGLGRLVRSWRQQARTLAQRTAELERVQEWRAQAAAAQERTRIARELHDVIAHSVSVMVVQAGAAEQMLDRDLERARESLATIQDSGQQAVVELRRMVGLLRDDEELSLAPQPSLRHLDTLANQTREAGLPVEVRIEGFPHELNPGLDLAAYRIVQEALTNTLKHAGPATTACVVVNYGSHALDIDVVDNGTKCPDVGPVLGNGLVGMRERVALYGGELTAGPRPEGGFAVHARLPSVGR